MEYYTCYLILKIEKLGIPDLEVTLHYEKRLFSCSLQLFLKSGNVIKDFSA